MPKRQKQIENQEKENIKNLKQKIEHKQLLLTKADKGNTLVIMYCGVIAQCEW
jgi:bifunctional ADP-heptose synthase (sugar kinase/adenylyltransferase)